METHNLPTPKGPTLSVGAVIALWVAKLLAAGFLGVAAWLKLTGHENEVKLFETLNWEPQGRYLIGGIEIVAAILILIPQSAIHGSFLGLGVMLGAIIGHLTKLPLDGIQYALLVSACCITVLYISRYDAKFIRNLFHR